MKKVKLAVMVLHYNNVNDTLECVESFERNIDTDDYFILVFDNASPNGSGKELLEKLKGHKNVEVYLNDKNLGFGGGNNKGIEIIKEKYDPEYLVLSNNDIVWLEKDFCKKLDEEFERCNFALLGPMIMTADGRCDSNPIFDTEYTRYAAKYNLNFLKRKLRMYKLHMFGLYMGLRGIAYRLFKGIRKKKPAPRKDRSDGIFLKRRENIVCHGCFMVFSKVFFSKFDGLDLRSFMYAEEDILYKHLMHEKMTTVYAPNILIYHKEGRSVGNTYGKGRKKAMFLLARYIEANEGYLQLLDELDKTAESK